MAADPPCRCGHDRDDHETTMLGADDFQPCADAGCDCSDYYPAWFRDGLHRLLWERVQP